MVEHPERFYPEIDLAWPQEQLKKRGLRALNRRLCRDGQNVSAPRIERMFST